MINLAVWYQIYHLWPESTTTQFTKRSKKKLKSTQEKTQRKDEIVDKDWFYHSCLYGHKEVLRKLLDKYPDSFKICDVSVNGNTAIHLGVFGNHLSIVQILLSRYRKEANLSLRNSDGFNPLDLALTNKNNAIIKLLMKNARPEISSLIIALETYQHDFVYAFCEKLKKSLDEQKASDFQSNLQKYLDLGTFINHVDTTFCQKLHNFRPLFRFSIFFSQFFINFPQFLSIFDYFWPFLDLFKVIFYHI